MLKSLMHARILGSNAILLLVVLGLAGWTIIRVVVHDGADRGGPVKAAREEILTLSLAVRQYSARTAHLPASLDALTGSDPITGKPYVKSIPTDPWGTPYLYRDLGRARFVLVSFGPDEQEGTEDDISGSDVDEK